MNLMRRRVLQAALVAWGVSMAANAVAASFPMMPLTRCAPDAVVAGTVCLDKYEASVWRVPSPTTTNASLVRRIQLGKATLVDLTAGGATQLGTASHDDYAPCADDGQTCANDIYEVSLPSVLPSAFINWFQAQEACANAGKRLPTNAEWQVGANGTPDTGGSDNGTTDCNTDFLTRRIEPTGSRSGCFARRVRHGRQRVQWVADWVPSRRRAPDGRLEHDLMCLWVRHRHGPGALLRHSACRPARSRCASPGRPPASAFRCAR